MIINNLEDEDEDTFEEKLYNNDKDEEDGELAYQFHMTILDEDLLNS